MQKDHINIVYSAKLIDDCTFSAFYKLVNFLEMELNIGFIDIVDDFDSLFYTFNYKEMKLILCYRVDDGIKLQLLASGKEV
ncbi:hypothetical protein DVR12_17815 [Chitinophaga silvatica]|uniref:Uncharacterized protein n=1 Tax=Chitinophaga silvatica TaxID=2282649 RepID=A0A3E1Y7V2_9BACT|nr:hypothetical protein [Chitinophaga silvatica]RFS21191.1 hypothetical protein DVR12_17815 [Chitinophaga silvatica]